MTPSFSTDIVHLAFQKWGIKLKKGSKTWSGSCPVCREGDDRLIVWQEGNYICRVCGTKGWLLSLKDLSPTERAYREKHLQKTEEEEKQRRAERLADWQSGFRAGLLISWHNMGQPQLDYWHSQGIPDWAIEQYNLGYCDKKLFQGQDELLFESPAYVIPIRDPIDNKLVNVQYRLTELPANGGGKYRQEPDLPAAAFYAEQGRLSGPVIVVEGSKKAIVMYNLLDKTIQIVGMPSQSPAGSLIQALGQFSEVFLALDKDIGKLDKSGYDAAVKRYGALLKGKCRLVPLSRKIDNSAIRYGMGKSGFLDLMHMARRV
mgnify:FL=1